MVRIGYAASDSRHLDLLLRRRRLARGNVRRVCYHHDHSRLSDGSSNVATTVLDKVLAAPRVWVRWPLHYLQEAPAILAIATFYAHHLEFGTLIDV
jgi:hypothetical protein